MKYDLTKYDFIDLGSKNGGSIDYCAKRFRTGKGEGSFAKGLGIDYSHEYVSASRKAGYDVIEHDILSLNLNHRFKFASALDFLEHMPSIDDAGKIVKKMSELATDFLFIRHPSFDDMAYLKAHGLKISWTDWSMHTALMQTYDFTNIFNGLGLRQYCFNYRGEIADSDDERIIPLDAPVDTHEYTKDLGKKPSFKFEKKVYAQIDIFVALRPLETKLWNWITREV